jgi:Tol biopolymer transport system component
VTKRNPLSRIPFFWRLTAGLCAVLTLITGSVTAANSMAPTASGTTTCLQFVTVDWNRFGQPVYPVLLDTDWDTSLAFPSLPAPVTVRTVAERAPYHVVQASRLRRIFSFPYLASVENTTTGTRVDLPSVVSNNSVLWSHDGSRLAYYSIETISQSNVYFLIVANADGSGSKTFPMPPFNQIATFSWSSDDQYLVVGDYFYTRLIRVADGVMTALVSHNGYESVSTFTWSPRGHQLAYLWAETGIPNHVVIYDPDTRSQHKYVRHDAKYWWDGRLLWSPDMQHIAAVGRTDSNLDIVALDGSGVSLAGVGWDNKSLASTWLSTSNRFVFMNGTNELITYNVATGAYQPLVSNVFDSHVELLADQHSLIFVQRQPDNTFALMKMDMRDNSLTPLLTVPPPSLVSRFHVLSDRTKLVAFLYENNVFTIVLYDTSTDERQQLASGLNDAYMLQSWSDPSTFMYYWSVGKNKRDRAGWTLRDLAGKRLAQFEGDEAAFAGINDTRFFASFWSPDRRYAVFAYDDADLYKGLLVMSSDGKQVWSLDQRVWGVDLSNILWSPDSSKVAFTVNIAGKAIVRVYTADGKLIATTDKSLLPEYMHWTACQP